MGGGGSSSTTRPIMPGWMNSFLQNTATQIAQGQSDMPLSDFFEMDPRQIADADPMQQAAYNNVGQFFNGPSPALSGAMDTANSLANPTPWQGTDLSGIGSVGGFSVAGPGSPPPGGATPPAPYRPTGRQAPAPMGGGNGNQQNGGSGGGFGQQSNSPGQPGGQPGGQPASPAAQPGAAAAK